MGERLCAHKKVEDARNITNRSSTFRPFGPPPDAAKAAPLSSNVSTHWKSRCESEESERRIVAINPRKLRRFWALLRGVRKGFGAYSVLGSTGQQNPGLSKWPVSGCVCAVR